MKISQFLAEKSEMETFRKNKIPLTDEEREKVYKAKAVWHPVTHEKPVSGIWKAKDSRGKIWYGCNTHRAWAKASTLKGAIKKFKFIKTTA